MEREGELYIGFVSKSGSRQLVMTDKEVKGKGRGWCASMCGSVRARARVATGEGRT